MSVKQRVKRYAASLGVLDELRAALRLTRQVPLLLLGLVLKEVLRFDRTYDRLMVTPGKNPWVELRSKNLFLSVLCSAYRVYDEKKMEVLSRTNEEFQQRYWSGFRAFYLSKAREDYRDDFYKTFDEYFCRALTTHPIRRCLDVGCGGFTHVLRLKADHPDLQFVGIDVSRVAEEIWTRSIKPVHEGIRFIPGSIARETEVLEEIDLFYSFGSLMYLAGSELEMFFSRLGGVSRSIVGIIVEPDSTDPGALTITRGHSFFHNYLEYFRLFGFRVLDYTRRQHHIETDLPMLFAYFSTR
jgi:hypothetical protein